MARTHSLIAAGKLGSSPQDAALKEQVQQYLRLQLSKQGLLSSWSGPRAALLQSELQRRDFRPAISADQLCQLFLLLRLEACQSLLQGQLSSGGANQAARLQLLRLVVQDSEVLCRLQPNHAGYLLRHATVLLGTGARQKALRQYSVAMDAAQATQGRLDAGSMFKRRDAPCAAASGLTDLFHPSICRAHCLLPGGRAICAFAAQPRMWHAWISRGCGNCLQSCSRHECHFDAAAGVGTRPHGPCF